ncbi:MAG: LysR substrate-binding domain-containing protein [Pseudomonadota bacterium]
MNNQTAIHRAIKLRHIRAFLDIAAEGNLSAVARAQGITQPALSRTLAELEDLLDQSLFLRQGRRLILTESGAVFRRHALATLQSLEAGVAAIRPGQGGAIRVGVLPTVATRFFPQVVLSFREMRPDVMLSIETGPHHYLIRLLRDGALDLMIGRLPAASEMSGLSFEHLYEEDVVLVARADHPLSHLPLTEVLANVPLILPPATALIRPAVDAYLASLGLNGVKPAIETVSLALGRGICLASDAMWFISRGVVIEDLSSGMMAERPTGARFLSGAVGITRRQGDPPSGLALLTSIAHGLARPNE